MEVSILEVLFFLTLLVYTAPHIMVFGAVPHLGIHSHLVHLYNHTTWSHLRRSKTSHKSSVHIGTGLVRSTGLHEGC